MQIKAETLEELLTSKIDFAIDDDPVRKMSALTYSTFIGLPSLNSATYQELQSTGNLGLIRNADLRSELTNHYSIYGRIVEILDVVSLITTIRTQQSACEFSGIPPAGSEALHVDSAA